MPHFKKKLAKHQRVEKFSSHSILSIPIGNWLLILLLVGILGFYFFWIFQEANHTSTSEIFEAEVSRVWMEQYESETGGSRAYKVRLKRDTEELTCTVPSIKKNIWQQLETGVRYEFSISITARGCYINQAVAIKE